MSTSAPDAGPDGEAEPRADAESRVGAEPGADAEPGVGAELVLDVGAVAHGGWCVARDGGRVVFVRHALPGERVLARVTDAGHARFWRADAVEVLAASPERVAAPCPHAGPGRCGGCDWQHASLPAQRRLKAEVVAEQLRRLARVTWAGEVRELPGHPDGLGWRTRMRFAVDPRDATLALRRHRSLELEPAADCRIAHPRVWDALPAGTRLPGAREVEAAVSGTGQVSVRVTPPSAAGPPGGAGGGAGGEDLVEVAAGRRFTLDPRVFWQVHPGAADTLAAQVRAALGPRPGERAWDLYAGAGLFAATLADDVGTSGRVHAVESDRRAVAAARANLAGLPQARVWQGAVGPALLRRLPGRLDVAVLDPPRAGAGGAVVRELLSRRPRAVAYVACDPASLARDVAHAAGAGYRLAGLRAYDLFPMTAHVECLALLVPARDTASEW